VRVDRERAEPTFVAHQLHYSRDVERQIALISGGAIMPGINVTKLKTIKLAVPSVSLQRCFADRVAAVDQLRARYSIAVEETDALFASLQHRAFNGELFS
jgi:type I restriction enzyme S subunit